MKVFYQALPNGEEDLDLQAYAEHRIERIKRESTPERIAAQKCSGKNARISRRMMELSLELTPGEACLYCIASGNIVRLYRRIDYPNQIDIFWNPDD